MTEALPPLTWAYVGDAVFELFVREQLLAQGIWRAGELHKHAIAHVQAAAQARALEQIMPELTEAERDLVRRARNAAPHHRRDAGDRRQVLHSTALEALLGYLYLSGQRQRLTEILTLIWRVQTEDGMDEPPKK